MRYRGKHTKQTSSAKGTKRALIASAACTILCGLLLFSTSIAWFSANKESGSNELYSGNLDITLSYSKDMTNWSEVTDETDDIFKVNGKNMLWEPGAVNVVYFKIENKGSLAAKYDFTVEIYSETQGKNFKDETFNLSDYIMGGVADVTGAYAVTDEGREAAITAAASTAKTLQAIDTGDPLITGEMAGIPAGSTETIDNTTKTFALVLYMPDDSVTGEKTNYKTPSDPALRPKIFLKLKFVATQMTGEADSFGDQYDKGAYEIKVPVVPSTAVTAAYMFKPMVQMQRQTSLTAHLQ